MLTAYVPEHCLWFTSFRIHDKKYFMYTPVKPTRKQKSRWRKKCLKDNPEGVYHDKIFSMPDDKFEQTIKAPH